MGAVVSCGLAVSAVVRRRDAGTTTDSQFRTLVHGHNEIFGLQIRGVSFQLAIPQEKHTAGRRLTPLFDSDKTLVSLVPGPSFSYANKPTG